MTERSAQIRLGDPVLAEERESAPCEERFAALVRNQSHFVFRVAYAVLRNAHDAEDAAQEVFLKIYRAGDWHKIEDERAYLARVAWRVAQSKRPKTGASTSTEEAASSERTPEQEMLQADWSAVVHRLIDALPEELRLPLALSAAEELTSKEIAGILGIPEGTVRSRMMKARAILKEKLERLAGDRHGQ